MQSDRLYEMHLLPRPAGRSTEAIRTLLVGLLMAGPIGGFARADSVDREMAFVEKTVQATELYNENRLAEALAVFKEIQRDYAELDEDGYVAMAVADCLSGLGRVDEARVAYDLAWTAHPDLQSTVRYRLIELDLTGVISDALIAELRQAVMAGGDARFAASWQLGRALQKRARTLLEEAAAAFRDAVDPESLRSVPHERLVSNHAAMLDELQEDLASLVEQMDAGWGSFRRLVDMSDCVQQPAGKGGNATESYRADWTVRAPDDRTLVLRAEGDMKSGQVRYTLNGQVINLKPTQALLIQRHQERINAILIEAAAQGESTEPGTR